LTWQGFVENGNSSGINVMFLGVAKNASDF
jgi:hypothetical protein